MTNIVEILDVTRRLQSDDIHLVRGTRVVLLAYLDDQRKVNLSFAVYPDAILKRRFIYEVDTVLDTFELPQPTGNKQQWERVRKILVQDNPPSPDDAWLKIAIENAARKWKFSMEEESSYSFSFSILVPGRAQPLEARVERANFFNSGD